jgi:hypothetical protein
MGCRRIGGCHLLALLTFIPALPAAAAEAVQPTQEVFQTELVYPQEAGEVQLTTRTRFRRSRDGSAAQVPLAIEYGITNR